MMIDSLLPLAGTGIVHFSFTGKRIADNDLSFLAEMKQLKTFDFAPNFYTTEQVAWIAANFPQLSGRSVGALADDYPDASDVSIVGKRKPYLQKKGNEARIQKYIDAFEALKKTYMGVPYRDAFPQ